MSTASLGLAGKSWSPGKGHLLLASLVFPWLGLPLGLQERAVVILALAACLWLTELLPLFVTSLLILYWQISWLNPLRGPGPAAQWFAETLSPYFSDMTLLFLGGFALSLLLQRSGVDRLLASRILRQTGGEPKSLLLALIAAAAFLSMWVSNTATAAMMIALVLPMAQRLSPHDPLRTSMLLAVPFGCNLGGLGTPIGTPPNSLALSALKQSGIHVSFIDWMLVSMPLMVVGCLGLWWVLVVLYPSQSRSLDLGQGEQPRLDDEAKQGLAVFITAALLWVFGGSIGLSSGMVGLMLVIWIFGSGGLPAKDFLRLPWDTLMMISGGLAMGRMMQWTGLGEDLVSYWPDSWPFFLTLMVLSGLAALLTTFMSNTASASLLLPLVMSLGQVAADQQLFALTVAWMCSLTMLLPVSTPPNAIAHGSGLLSSRAMLKTASLHGVGMLLLQWVYLYLLSLWIGG